MRSLLAPLRMGNGLPSDSIIVAEEEEKKFQISERDLAKLERRKRKEERERQVTSPPLTPPCLLR